MKQSEIIQKLRENGIETIHDAQPFPKAFGKANKNIKAIILGCDPSNFSGKNGETVILDTVFGIGTDERYFRQILANLNQLNLKLSDIYVQNLCRNYFPAETAKNKQWYDAAKIWIEYLNAEIDSFDVNQKIPVFLTSFELYKALVKKEAQHSKPKFYYENPQELPVKPAENYLNRPLLPLWRGGNGFYNLEKWDKYKEEVKLKLGF